MKPASYEDLDTRANNQPESVALFTDEELVRYATESVSGESFDQQVVGYVFAEMLVRLWLYRARPAEIQNGVQVISGKLGAEHLLQRFERGSIFGLRDLTWSTDVEETLNAAFQSTPPLRPDEEAVAEFVRDRIRAFLNCDGVIPVAVGGDAVAIPFDIIRDRTDGKILDSDNKPIDGWISNTKELWKAMSGQFCIRLECAFGDHAIVTNGEHLVSGGSFALPVLFAATRNRDSGRELHPLAVICTGEFSSGLLKRIDARDRKHELAVRIGAELFVAPGMGSEWIVQPGNEVRRAIEKISQRLGENPSALAARMRRLDSLGRTPFSKDIRELTVGFVGREYQVREVVEWIGRKMTYVDAPARLWIGGELGCGKSAFMAALSQECAEKDDWHIVRYFFGRTSAKKQTDFLQSAAQQIATMFGLDHGEIALKSDPNEQFRFAIDESATNRKTRLIFLLDGVNEAESKGPLTLLADSATATSDCIWLFAGQPTLETQPIRDLPDVEDFHGENGLGRLLLDSMHKLIDVAAEDMPDELRGEIVRRSRGLPLYTKLMLDKWDKERRSMTIADLPEDMEATYKAFVEDIARYRKLDEEPWRTPIPRMLALLATAREGIPLAARTLQYALTPLYPQSSESHIESALGACISVLRPTDPERISDEGTSVVLWTINHDSFREFFTREQSPMKDFTIWAKQRWAAICNEWDKDIETGAKQYALRFLLDELDDQGDSSSILSLARNHRFIELQRCEIGSQLALETFSRAIKIALQCTNLPDAARLTIARAKWAGWAFAKSPLDALRQDNVPWALELVSRIENQHDRTLWHFAVAAWHVCRDQPQLAAQVVDDHIPASALRERLPAGASMCAAALLCMLYGLKTRRFRWGWFLSQLTDESKREAARVMIKSGRMNAAWSLLGSIQDENDRNDAQLEAVREIVTTDPKLAERQLSRFNKEDKRAWATQEVVAAYAQRRWWREMDHALAKLDRLSTPRQRAKALCYVEVMLDRDGDRTGSERALDEAVRLINRCGSLDMQAIVWAEFGLAHAEVGDTSKAEDGFRTAFKLLEEAVEEDKDKRRPRQFGKFTHLKQAARYITLVMCLARLAERDRRFLVALKTAVRSARQALRETEKDPKQLTKVNSAWRRLLKLLASKGHFDLAYETLERIRGDEPRTEAAARLCVYLLRRGETPSKDLGRDGRMLVAGMKALELIVARSKREALDEACGGLFNPGRQKGFAQLWGPPRVLSVAGALMAHNGDNRADSLFDTAEAALHEIHRHRGWYLAELAFQCAACGRCDRARDLLIQTRAHLPATEDEAFRLLAKAEQIELKFALRLPIEVETSGVYAKVLTLSDGNLTHKLKLIHRLVTGFAEAARYQELDQLCLYAHEHLKDDRYHLLPEERSILAGDFAADLAKAALNMPDLKGWAVKFEQICENLRHDPESAAPIPDSVLRARALMAAIDRPQRRSMEARQIRGGKERSKALRDLALYAVKRGAYKEAGRLCLHIEHDRSDHLPDVALAVAQKNECSNLEASALFNQLLVSCSHYLNAAYRSVAALILFYKPDQETLMSILEATKAYRSS